MSKRTERNEVINENSQPMTRQEIVDDIKTYLKESAKGTSGNAQRNIIDVILMLISEDMKNDEWASTEYSTYTKIWNSICDEWSDEEGNFVGLTPKSEHIVYEFINEALFLKSLKKLDNKISIDSIWRKSAYETIVDFAIDGEEFSLSFRSATGKASGSTPVFLPAKLTRQWKASEAVVDAALTLKLLLKELSFTL